MACFATPYGLRYVAHCFNRAHAQNNRPALIPTGGKLAFTSGAKDTSTVWLTPFSLSDIKRADDALLPASKCGISPSCGDRRQQIVSLAYDQFNHLHPADVGFERKGPFAKPNLRGSRKKAAIAVDLEDHRIGLIAA